MKQNLRGISYHFLDLWYWTCLCDWQINFGGIFCWM